MLYSCILGQDAYQHLGAWEGVENTAMEKEVLLSGNRKTTIYFCIPTQCHLMQYSNCSNIAIKIQILY
jgi:hypothetical protein